MTRGSQAFTHFAWLWIGMSACASAREDVVPQWYLEPSRVSACPQQRFLVGTGQSNDSQDDARSRALASVVGQISSRVESELEDLSIAVHGGPHGPHGTTKRRIRVTTAYGRADLVTYPRAGRAGQTWYALACLERKAVIEALSPDVDLRMLRFNGAAVQAAAAVSTKNRAAFTKNYREAWAEAKHVMPLLLQLGSVADRSEADARRRSVLDALSVLEGDAAQFRRSTAVACVPDWSKLPPDEADLLAGKFQSAVSNLGVQATTGAAAACSPTMPETLLLEPRAEVHCRWAHLGHTCTTRIHMSVRQCGAERGWVASPLASERDGIDPRDSDKALRVALHSFSADLISTWLRAALASEIPTAEDGF